jgi:hypothetical protein
VELGCALAEVINGVGGNGNCRGDISGTPVGSERAGKNVNLNKFQLLNEIEKFEVVWMYSNGTGYRWNGLVWKGKLML